MSCSDLSPLLSPALRVPAHHIARFAGLAQSVGQGDPGIQNILRGARARGREVGVSLSDYWRLLKALAMSAGEETFRLSARPLMTGSADFVFHAAEQTATLGEAMREIARAYNLLHGHDYNRVETRGRLLVYQLDDEAFPYTHPRDDFLDFTLESTLIFLHGAICELADADLAAHARHIFTRRRQASTTGVAALAFWDAPVSYGEKVYGVAYDAEIAALPVRRRPRHMPLHLAIHNRILALVEQRESGGARREAVDVEVVRALNDGLRDQADVAARLGLSLATLRRRLALRGASFRELRQGVLRRAACLRLEETGSVADTAEALGFSDPRSFSRAFKSLTGETPSAFAGRVRNA
jgi:AraC-like DNA-binding protein